MTAPLLDSDDLLQAASLAFAMVRFASGAAHPARQSSIAGELRLGDQAYQFIPGPRRVPLAEVPRYLAALPSPAVLIPTTTRGIVALTLVDELAGERLASIRHEFANQEAAVDLVSSELGLKADSRVLLEFDQESHAFTLAALRLSHQRFAVLVGWNVTPLRRDVRAAARLNLFRTDGINSSGFEFPGRPV